MATHYVNTRSSSSESLSSGYEKLLGKTVQFGGKKYIYARAASSLTKNTPYRLYYAGGVDGTDPSVGAFVDGTLYNLVVVPVFRTLTTNDTDWFQYQGPVTGAILANYDYTPTYALRVHDGVIKQISAVPTNGNAELGCVMARASTGAVTLADIFLFGREALGAT